MRLSGQFEIGLSLPDRYMVKCIAAGGDPATTKVAELAEGKPVTVDADDSVEEALRTMNEHGDVASRSSMGTK
jgi:CBS domain-containing protein